MTEGYGQYCPLAKGAEVFAERWTPLILRELLRGSTTFNDLHRGVPRMSRSLLSGRLARLIADRGCCPLELPRTSLGFVLESSLELWSAPEMDKFGVRVK